MIWEESNHSADGDGAERTGVDNRIEVGRHARFDRNEVYLQEQGGDHRGEYLKALKWD